MLRCMRCPAAYHKRDGCVPAGADLRNNNWLICPDHFDAKEAAQPKGHVNVDYCFDCQTGTTIRVTAQILMGGGGLVL